MDDDKIKDQHEADDFDFLSHPMDNLSSKNDDFLQTSPLVSTTRPLLTPPGDTSKTPSPTDDILCSPAFDNYPSSGDNPPQASLIDFDIDKKSTTLSSSAVSDSFAAGRHDAALSIDSRGYEFEPQLKNDAFSAAPEPIASKPQKIVDEERFDAVKTAPEIGFHPANKLDDESAAEKRQSAYELITQIQPSTAVPAKKEDAAAMEGDALKTDGCFCPFSPGVFFNPEKLNPTVAEYVYWRDVKKSGVCFGLSLLLLLSLKYFSFISVSAYLLLAVLSTTISFRIYKNILQAIQKSNEGHPFKEYLEMDITLSHEKLKDASEVLIGHVNSVTQKLRSLILVEDLFDTIKLFGLAWVMTYIGAWFNGMTVIILGLVSAFTLPKVYETNKAQIDTYAEILRLKSKEIMDMINSKIPLGKKKKDE